MKVFRMEKQEIEEKIGMLSKSIEEKILVRENHLKICRILHDDIERLEIEKKSFRDKLLADPHEMPNV